MKLGGMFHTNISWLFSAAAGHRFKEATTSHSNGPLWIQRGPARHLSTGLLISLWAAPVNAIVFHKRLKSVWTRKGPPGFHPCTFLHHLFPLPIMTSLPILSRWDSYISFKVQFNGNLSVQPSLSGVAGGSLLCDPQHHFPVFSAYHRGYEVSPAPPAHHRSPGQKRAFCVTAWQCGLGLKVGLCNQKPTLLLKAGSPRHHCLTPLGLPHVPHL